MFEAVVHNTPEVVSALLEAGAKVNIQNLSAMTPLALAASRGTDLETVKLLLQFGADIEEMSPLWHAIDYARENTALEGTDVLQMLERSSPI
ncbi:ankyrin repeat domain-containing protein [Fretibacterium sp. OH1220_COT-178]|uniref:ankyrin repeat domain-containing protein n=1 Tax=Fretibacterium sp. OH1220_COT-178 TaxID=2491047 RepID=UPI00131521B7|nr:ankyrin repeat domain-containing protein [Fretibacterium sp. OH1220_COT-178]